MSATSRLKAREPTSGREAQHHLRDDEISHFLERAALLGHDAGRLLAGEAVESLVRVSSLDYGRRLPNVSAAERRARQDVFFHPAMAIRSRIGQGVHDRCEAYLFADGHIDPADEARLATQLPFPCRFLSVLHRRVARGEVWDLTVEGARLGVDERHDVVNVVNVGELVIEPGGRVIAQGNLWILGCQHLEYHAPSVHDPGYQIGVLPTPHSVDPRNGPMNGHAGASGADGQPGRPGVAPRGIPTMLGFSPSEPPGERMNGTDGDAGTRGGAGERGRTGGATKTAEITIGRLSGSVTVLASGGRGGSGGGGGHGGHGGDGGAPAPAMNSVNGTIPAGRPGQGGRGGDGGDGGNGGNGGICSNVFVTLPGESAGRLRVVTIGAGGGAGGAGGRPGRGGRAGQAGGTAGADGNDGSDGAHGKQGRDGRARPAPEVFVNGAPYAGKGTSP